MPNLVKSDAIDQSIASKCLLPIYTVHEIKAVDSATYCKENAYISAQPKLHIGLTRPE